MHLTKHLLKFPIHLATVGTLLLVTGLLDAAPQNATRARLALVATETEELIKNAKESGLANWVAPRLFDDRTDLAAKRFPTRGDVNRYAKQRPWMQEYLLLLARPRQIEFVDSAWPRGQSGAELRDLLQDSDPILRGLAIEALATLHDPDDVPRIAKLLGDQAESIPSLGWNRMVSSAPINDFADNEEALNLERSWQPRRVSGYAKAALKLMTGQDFDASNFEKWWEHNHDGKQCVWFWRERLHRDLAIAERADPVDWNKTFQNGTHESAIKRHYEEIEKRFAKVRETVGAELKKLPVDIEVKIRLFALNEYSSGLGCSLDAPLIGNFKCRRVSSEWLLDLLDRKISWDDVEWNGKNYNSAVVQVVGQAERFFTLKDVPRLQATQKRENEVWWNGRAEFFVGISRLLPPAPANNLDDPDTQDGFLRKGVRGLKETFSRGKVARELVRTGLPQNWDFLVEQFLTEKSRSEIPDMRGSILQELGTSPSDKKRKALALLLLDKRFEAFWTEPRGGMGDDQHRLDAIRAVNNYAGREVLTDKHDEQLADPAQAAKTLVEVKKIVRETLGSEDQPK